MNTKHNNQKPLIGGGIYTLGDVSMIMGTSYHKVHRWINKHWDEVLSDGFYTWTESKSKAIGFHTLIELIVFAQFGEVGVSTKDILKAHKILGTKYNTPFPFALSSVLNYLRTDGKRIYLTSGDEDIYCLDGKNQLNLHFIHEFIKNIEFGSDSLAKRYWPMGPQKSVVVDPEHQLGQPVLTGTNIQAASIYAMYKGGDSAEFIAYVYQLDQKQVSDALNFCRKAA